MTQPGVWKAATVVATAAAVYGLVVRPRAAAAPQVEHESAERESGSRREARTGSSTGGTYRAAPSRVPQLAAQLRAARGPQVACNLITVIADTGERAAVDPLVEALHQRRDDEVRTCAAESLALLPFDTALDALMEAARDPAVRAAVFGGLARSRDPGAVAFVLDVARSTADDADAEAARIDAMVALGEAQRPEAAPLIGAVFEAGGPEDSWERLIVALGRTRDADAVPPLERLVYRYGDYYGEQALAALGATGQPAAVEVLRAVMYEGGSNANLAADALVNCTAPAALAVLLGAAREQGAVRSVAFTALVRWDGDEPRELMLAQVRDENATDYESAVGYFGNRHDRLVIPELVAALTRPEPTNAVEPTLEAITRIGGDAALDALTQLASRGESSVRSDALVHLASVPGGRAVAADVALRWSQSGDENFSSYDALACASCPEARAALLAAAHGVGGQASSAVGALAGLRDADAARALDALARTSPNESARGTAMRALWERGEAMDLATRALDGPDEGLRRQAQAALQNGNGPAVDRALLEVARTGDAERGAWAVTTLARRGAPDTLTQLEAVARRSPTLAATAATELARRSPRRAASLIDASLRSDDPQAQRAAVGAAARMVWGDARPLFVTASASRDDETALTSVRYLANDSGAESTRALLAMLARPDASVTVRQAAALSLQRRTGADVDAARAAINALLAPPEPAREPTEPGAPMVR